MIGSFVSMLEVPAVLGLVLKVTATLACGVLIAALAHRQAAATRHFVWLIALSSALALAVLTPIAPRVTFQVPAPPGLEASRGPSVERALEPGRTQKNATADRGGTILDGVGDATAARLMGHAPQHTWTLGVARALGVVWLAGCLAVLLRCLLGHLGLARLDRAAAPIDRRVWCALIRDARSRRVLESGVRLGFSSSVGTPLTWGWPRPVILLPYEADSWPAERRRVALLHELAHVERCDYLAQLVSMLACAIYWFHPLAWAAASRLRSEGERACDDRVLAAGTPAHEYASTLLEVARRARTFRRAEFAGVGMARPSHLEGRLLAVLDDSRPRGTVSRRAAAAALAVVGLLLVPFAGLVPRLVPAAAWAHSAVPAQVASTSETAPAGTFERTISTTSSERLRLDLETGGAVEIRGWDQPAVQVRVQLRGKDWRDTRVEAEHEGGGVVVRSIQAGERQFYSTSHVFEIHVPKRYDVWLNSAGGGVKIVQVEGTFHGHTGGGGIVLERDKGRARLTTGGGDVRVSDSQLDGSVTTGGGMVRISRVRGDLHGSSGSGPVIESDGMETAGEGGTSRDLRGVTVDDAHRRVGIARDARTGFLRVNRTGGDVDLEEAPEGARITTGGGDIRVGRAAGTVDANTGGGDIEIGPVAGSVRAGTGAGNVRVSLADADGKTQTVEITSGTGKVVVEVPDHLGARFELETAYTKSFGRATRIESAWTLDREATTRWDASEGTPRRYVRAKGVVGNGRGLIWVRTVNGDIEVRRPSEEVR